MQFKQWNLPLTGLVEITKKRAIIHICYFIFIVILKFVSAMLVKPWSWKQCAVGSAGKQNNLLSFIDPVRLRAAVRYFALSRARTPSNTQLFLSVTASCASWWKWDSCDYATSFYYVSVLAGYRLPVSLNVHARDTSYCSHTFRSPITIW